ncbi:hypothetical protein BS78_10G189300 [Paspalum vaginatum]|nr:hypothetical protein BS78_10G189300 [Paspalum vaginatum]
MIDCLIWGLRHSIQGRPLSPEQPPAGLAAAAIFHLFANALYQDALRWLHVSDDPASYVVVANRGEECSCRLLVVTSVHACIYLRLGPGRAINGDPTMGQNMVWLGESALCPVSTHPI